MKSTASVMRTCFRSLDVEEEEVQRLFRRRRRLSSALRGGFIDRRHTIGKRLKEANQVLNYEYIVHDICRATDRTT